MGRPYVEFSFPDSGSPPVTFHYSAFLRYRMPDGYLLPIHQTICWCHSCADFRLCEELGSPAGCRARIQEIRWPNEGFAFGESPEIKRRVQEQLRRIRWLKSRRSPAKCLTCGNPDVVLISHKLDSFFHPVTGERVERSCDGVDSIGTWEAIYTPEGDFIAEMVIPRH